MVPGCFYSVAQADSCDRDHMTLEVERMCYLAL